MTNRKTTKRALLTSVTALALCVVMLVGTTFAWFTDTATTNVNKIQAGNLDVALEVLRDGSWVDAKNETLNWVKHSDGAGQELLWEPGASYNLETFRIVNKGNLNLKYKVVITGATGDVELLNVIDFAGNITQGMIEKEPVVSTQANETEKLDKVNMNDNAPVVADRVLTPGQYDEVTLNGTMQTTAGNTYMNKTVSGISITVYAAQATGEYDSFSDQYDKDAAYPTVAPVLNTTDSADVTLTNNALPATEISANGATSTVPDGTTMKNGDTDVTADTGAGTLKRVITTKVTSDKNGNDVATYDISYNFVQDGTTTAVTEFSNVVTNKIQLSAGLTEVTVTHTHGDADPVEMTEAVADADMGKDGYFHYNATTGLLTIWSSKYSSFAVSYKVNFAAAIGDQYFATLTEAVKAAKDGDTITLVKDSNGNGIVFPENKFNDKGLTIDFNGHTYTVGGVLVGSATTKTNAFQLLKSNKITLKNGSFVGATEGSVAGPDTDWVGAPAILIQNYSDLTLDNMVVSGGDETCYTMSNNNGKVVINNTTINSGKSKGNETKYPPVALDVCRFSTYPSVDVTVTGNSVINGDVEVSGMVGAGQNRQLTINGGKFYGKFKVANEPANITINSGAFTDLASAVKYAADGATISLAADASGSGIMTSDGDKVRENLTIDFAGHTYTVTGPAVGSTGTKSQAMHWGASVGAVTMKNGTFEVAKNAENVKMAMQNHSSFTAENMVFDFTSVKVEHYGNQFTGANAIFNGKECALFNNSDSSSQMKLTNCIVTLPENSNYGGVICGKLTLDNTHFNGNLCFIDAESTITVSNGSTIKDNTVKNYFEDKFEITETNGVWKATAKNA